MNGGLSMVSKDKKIEKRGNSREKKTKNVKGRRLRSVNKK